MTANDTPKDVLYEGQTQTSDLPSSGNPGTYYNGKDYTFTWTKGRPLSAAPDAGKQDTYHTDAGGCHQEKDADIEVEHFHPFAERQTTE